MQTVGIDVDEKLKIAFVKKKKESFEVHCKEIPLRSKDVKPLYNKPTCTGLLANEFLIHDLKINSISSYATKKALSFQLDLLSHLKNKVDFAQFIKKDNVSSYFSVYTTTKDSIESHLNYYKKLHIDPDYVSTIPSALVAFADYSMGIREGIALDVGKTKTTLVLFEKEKIKKTFSISIGSNDLIDTQTNKGKVDLLTMKIEKNTALETFIKKLKSAFFSLTKEKKPLILTGDHQPFDFAPFLLENFLDWIDLIEKPENSSFATAIGLGIIRQSPKCVQFRQKGFIPKKFIRKSLQRYFALFAFSLVGSLAFYFVKSHEINSEDERITQAFNIAYLQDDVGKVKEEKSLPFTQKYSTWNKALKNKNFPFFFEGPRATDVLAWLEAHPLTSTIEIEKLDYKLVSFPKIGSPAAPYKVQVQLEYKASKSDAKKFYDLIIQNKEFVDQKQKATWNTLNDRYRITFFCKTKSLVEA